MSEYEPASTRLIDPRAERDFTNHQLMRGMQQLMETKSKPIIDLLESVVGEYTPDMFKELAYLKHEFTIVDTAEDKNAALDLLSDFCDGHGLSRAQEKALRTNLLLGDGAQVNAETPVLADVKADGVAADALEPVTEASTSTGETQQSSEFAVGQRVIVKRTNGDVEDDWVVKTIYIDDNPKKYTVAKIGSENDDPRHLPLVKTLSEPDLLVMQSLTAESTKDTIKTPEFTVGERAAFDHEGKRYVVTLTSAQSDLKHPGKFVYDFEYTREDGSLGKGYVPEEELLHIDDAGNAIDEYGVILPEPVEPAVAEPSTSANGDIVDADIVDDTSEPLDDDIDADVRQLRFTFTPDGTDTPLTGTLKGIRNSNGLYILLADDGNHYEVNQADLVALPEDDSTPGGTAGTGAGGDSGIGTSAGDSAAQPDNDMANNQASNVWEKTKQAGTAKFAAVSAYLLSQREKWKNVSPELKKRYAMVGDVATTQTGNIKAKTAESWERVKQAPTAAYVAVNDYLFKQKEKWNTLPPEKKKRYAIIGGIAAGATLLAGAYLVTRGLDTGGGHGNGGATTTATEVVDLSNDPMVTNGADIAPPDPSIVGGNGVDGLTQPQEAFADSHTSYSWDAAAEVYGRNAATPALEQAVDAAKAAGVNVVEHGARGSQNWWLSVNGNSQASYVNEALASYMPKR